jgi:hypothetical protein
VLAACSSESIAPSVKVESVTPDTVTMSNDAANDVTITVGYEDGDGDLGGGVAEVHDCRADALVTMLAIPPIASPDRVAAKDPISGTLALYVNDIGATTSAPLPPTCSDLGVAALSDGQTVMCVILVDAAGHRGTGDCTKPITLLP